MTRKLIKIAKELNVASSTIVEFLNNSGFEIDNKPIAKITDEMYSLLLDEFSSAIHEKELADELLQQRLERKKSDVEDVVEKSVTKEVPTEKEEAPVEKKEAPVEKEKEEEKVEEKKEEEKEVIEVEEKVEEKKEEEEVHKPEIKEDDKPKLKVVGKIDLEKTRKKKKVEPVKKEKEKVEKKKAEAVKDEDSAEIQEPVVDKSEETKKEPEVPKESLIHRSKTPVLPGLKILGKVDKDKLQPKEKKKKEKPEQRATKAPANANDDPSKKKRRRKRKKVNIEQIGRQAGKNRRNTDEVKEVSQKEIDDKIKATMERLRGTGKSKRQKIRKDSREVKREKQELKSIDQETSVIQLTEFVTVSELSSLMEVEPIEVITTCFNLGVIVSINQRLDKDVIELLAEEFDQEITFISAEDADDDIDDIQDEEKDLLPRAPIVTVMGHVDHGKTSLLDFIREANVAEGEAGGITQHIGAYEVKVGKDQKKITFLDTPGHEAFTAMRARGAKITDIVIIIIAADDKIMPQTKEAISHAQAAGVSIVFAINKIDKPGADPEKIKQELASMNLLVEEWGGKFQSHDISAKTGIGIDVLLEKVVLEAEILELKANPDRRAIGTVIEASLDKGRGYITKVLVQKGTLSIGDVIVSGEYMGKVKALFNEKGKKVKKVGPSSPILVLGLNGASQAGEKFKEVENEKEAKAIAAKRAIIAREQTTRAQKRISLDEIGRRIQLGTFKELNLIVKGDVDGSVEALSDSLQKLSIETIQVNIVHKAVGQITESDVLLATASDAIIVGFQVRPSGGARKVAEKEGVQIKTYSVIYEAIDQIKLAMEGMLEPTQEEKVLGVVEIRETYKISKVGTIAGCYVTEGKVTRNAFIRLIRDGVVIYPTKEGQTAQLNSLKRFKDDAREVKAGLECGLSVENYNDIKVGDEIEAYEIVEIKTTM